MNQRAENLAMLQFTEETMDYRTHRRAGQATPEFCAPASFADALADDLGLVELARIDLQFRVASVLGTGRMGRGTTIAALTQLVHRLYLEVVEVGPSPSVADLDRHKAAGFNILLLVTGVDVGHAMRFLGTEIDLSLLLGVNRRARDGARVARIFDPLRSRYGAHAMPELVRAPCLEHRMKGGLALCFRSLNRAALGL